MNYPAWWNNERPYKMVDCMGPEGMPSIPDEVVKVVAVDPPYGVDYVSQRYKGPDPDQRKNCPFGEMVGDKKFDPDYTYLWLDEAKRIMTKDSSIFIFSSYQVIYQWMSVIEQVFNIKNVIVWVKDNHTAGDTRGNFANQHELIVYATKGKPKLRGGYRWNNVWEFDRDWVEGHPTAKPAMLVARIIKTMTEKDDITLDPFLGSGTTLLAGRMAGRVALGFEIDQTYKSVIEKRMLEGVDLIEKYIGGNKLGKEI